MSTKDRAQQFRASVETLLPDGAFLSEPQLGLSNMARVYEHHILLGGPNLSGFMEGPERPAMGVVSCISPLLNIEIHFAAVITAQNKQVRTTVQELSDARVAQGQTAGYNNTPIALSQNGEVLVKLGKDTGYRSTNVKPDRVFLAVYPGDARSRLNPSVQEFVALMKALLGDTAVQPLDLWAEQSITQEMRRLPQSIPFTEIEGGILRLGGTYRSDLVKRFHNGLSFHPRKHFVILSGLSGTGKTSLAQRYAYAVHGITSLRTEDPLFFWCRVRPDWTDPSGLLGHYDVFSGKYLVPPFLDALLTANAYPSSPVFVCLDEMNLARVEYYLADVLSAMETPDSRLQLHTQASAFEGDSGVRVAKTVPWPSNIFIIGTINVDETTNMPSPKVLDRAVLIDISEIDVNAIITKLATETPRLKWAAEFCGSTLWQLYTTLKKHQLAFGFRTIDEVVRYVAFAADAKTNVEGRRVLDEQINQKILTKLRGTQEQAGMIVDLKVLLDGFDLCNETLKRFDDELREVGSFQGIR